MEDSLTAWITGVVIGAAVVLLIWVPAYMTAKHSTSRICIEAKAKGYELEQCEKWND